VTLELKVYQNDNYQSLVRRLVFILSADETQKIGFVPAAKVDEEWNKETSNFDNEEVKEVDGVLSFPKASNKKQILSKEQLVSQVEAF